MSEIIHLKRSPPLQPRQPETSAQATARERRRREAHAVRQMIEVMARLHWDFPQDPAPATLWKRMGSTQKVALFAFLERSIPNLVRLHDRAPAKLIEAWDELYGRETRSDAHFWSADQLF
jgi:hypothetical protein